MVAAAHVYWSASCCRALVSSALGVLAPRMPPMPPPPRPGKPPPAGALPTVGAVPARGKLPRLPPGGKPPGRPRPPKPPPTAGAAVGNAPVWGTPAVAIDAAVGAIRPATTAADRA